MVTAEGAKQTSVTSVMGMYQMWKEAEKMPHKPFAVTAGAEITLFVQNKAVYVYTGPMKLAMYRFKYSNCRTYGKTFVEDVWKMHAIWLQNLSVDAVVPVPMYRKKEKKTWL